VSTVEWLADFVTAATWSVGGLLSGYSVGRTGRLLRAVRDRLETLQQQPPRHREQD
jgi:hypothetical protein